MKAKIILHTGVATVVESAKGDGRRWGARDERRSDDEVDAMGPWCEGAPFQPACGCTGSRLQPQRSVNPLTTRIRHFSLNKFEKNLKKYSRIENNILYYFI